MDFEYAYSWLTRGERRQKIILDLEQPSTAKQISSRIQASLDACSRSLLELSLFEIVRCLNPKAVRSRVYWLTQLGIACQERLRKRHRLAPVYYSFPEVDWELYGWVLYSHRSAVLRMLDRPMKPADLRRKARFHLPNVRMSANNVRDVIRAFLPRGIVEPLNVRGSVYTYYKLTDIGLKLQALIQRVDPPSTNADTVSLSDWF